MAFTTKINLADSKVFQSTGSGSTLHLSGTTIIASVGTLKYATHPTFTGGTQVIDKQYVDMKITGATGTTIYTLGSPAAVQVGGINVNYVLTGKSTNCILQDMLYPEICGVLTAPSMTSVDLAPSTSPVEIGSTISSLSVTANFSRGSINPSGQSQCYERSGPATCYCFTGAQINGLYACTANSAVAPTVTGYTVVSGPNTWGARTCYSIGTQPKSNKGNNFSSPLSAGIASLCENSIDGILPYFYGVSTSVPTPGSALLTGGTKVVACSNATNAVQITFGAQTGKYLWFATPAISATKLGWYEGATNKGNIGSVTDLFNAPTTMGVNSPSGYWTGCSYKIYVSNYSTDTSANDYCMTNTAQQ
jgi:hypothetical protein